MTTPFQPGYGGVGTLATPPGALVPTGFSPAPFLLLQAATPVAGFALVNATPNILTWNVPNDGQLHRFMVIGELVVTVLQAGGAVQVAFNSPDGVARTASLLGGTLAAGITSINSPTGQLARTVQPGSQVIVQENTAQTAGAATLWAEIWGS